MSAFLDGIGNIIGKISDHIQGRIERLKNEKERLINEKIEIMRGPADIASTRKVDKINKRIEEINFILANKAKD